ncbi:MAG: TonB-dependent receptor [Acidobacteriota bacterium]
MRSRIWCFFFLALALIAAPVLAGDVAGSISRDDGSTIGGVTVVLSELGMVEITDDDGVFRFANVPAGTYTLSFSLGDNVDSQSVEVADDQPVDVAKVVDWDVSFAETITVYSASRRRERIVDAPASVTVVTEEEISRETSSGQVPKVLEFAPGVEVTQSGIHDFNLNMRGFNSSLNRRVQVLIDGRNPQVPFLSNQEWAYLSNMNDLESIELVRGPSSALYGANAFNGVLNMTTKAPRSSVGGRATVAAGELSTYRADGSWSFDLGSGWYGRLSGQYTEGESFYEPRVGTIEYDGLPFEAVAGTGDYDSTTAQLRIDKELFDGTDLLTVEGGYYDSFGGVTVTGIGRVQVADAERTFFRGNYNSRYFNVIAYQNTREAPDQLALSSGNLISLDSEERVAEIQGNGDFFDGKVRLVGGASYGETEIDTASPRGNQTLTFEPVESDEEAVFAQLDFDIADNLKLVLAGRWDDSTLHDSQVSPKAALVWNVSTNHTLRFSYNEAFQVANFSEFFLNAPTAFPGNPPISAIPLGAIEAGLCAPFGVSCGFDVVPVRALGNDVLEVEEITAIEVGYAGIFGSKAYLTIDFYQNQLENFITDLLPNPFGSINPAFGPYQPPANHPAPDLLLQTLQASLPPTVFPFLSNNPDGSPIFALASYTNAGEVDTEGIDLGLNYYITPDWVFNFSYSWFDFDVVDLGGVQTSLVPNAPENKFSAGIAYNAERWGFSLDYRWTDDFAWEAGIFEGFVDSYSIVNFSGRYAITDTIDFGLNVSNLLDDESYQSFGGDILGRRAVGSVTFNW